MTLVFLLLAGICLALCVLVIAAMANTPIPSKQSGWFAFLLACGVPGFLVLALLSWLFGGSP